MEENSKDAEVRARVPMTMYEELSRIADARGEKVPVILREALTDYLARRAAGSTTKPHAPGSDALMQVLRDQPEVAKALINLGNILKQPSSAGEPSPTKSAIAGGMEKKTLASAPPPVRYRTPRKKPAKSSPS